MLLCAIASAPIVAVASSREVFGFGGGSNWRLYDWSVLTTYVDVSSVNGFDTIDQELVKLAHQHGAKVCPFAPGDEQSGQITPPLTANKTARTEWVTKTVAGLVK